MGDFNLTEILLLVVVGLLLFGPSRIPELARQCGRAVNMFKRGLKETIEDSPTVVSSEPKSLPASPADADEKAVHPQA